MDSDNRYAPPKALVEDATSGSDAGPAPALWNPNAAASWSLLFSPVFGTWLHMRNWQALGEPQRADAARNWFIAAVVLIAISMLVAVGAHSSLDGLLRLATFAFLIAWYYAAAKPQAAYVRQRFGTAYPRKGWGLPILAAIGAIVAAIVVMTVLVILGVV
ncbi:MAG TPA: hypothetical protein VIP05_27740 [Burkholderiaceae bacterium]